MIDNYNDLTIGKYQKIKEINDAGYDESESHIQIIAVLADMDIDEVANMNILEFKKYNQKLEFLLDLPPKRAVATKYNLGGMELETMLAVDEMTVAQYIDYQTYLKDSDKYLVELLSVFLIPKKKTYGEGYDIIEVQKVIRENLSIVDAISLSAFFLQWYLALTEVTVTSLTKKMKRMMRKEKDTEKKMVLQKAIQDLEQNGLGFLW